MFRFDSPSQSQAANHLSVNQQESELPYTLRPALTSIKILCLTRAAVGSLKPGKSGGADKLDPEHLKYGGYVLHAWLLRIFTIIVGDGSIPPSLKLGLIVQVYKGKGRDPLNLNSYRGNYANLCSFKMSGKEIAWK